MRILLAATVLLGCGSWSLADDCIRSRAVYHAPYVSTYQNTYANVVLVPQVIPVEVQAAHYYSIAPDFQTPAIVDAISRLLQQERAGNQPPAPTAPVPQPSAPTQVIQPQRVTSRSAGASAYQAPELIALVQNSCAKCHSNGQQLSLLTPDGKALADLTKVQALTTYYLVNKGDMPKAANPVEDKFMPLFAEWVKASK